MSCKNVRQVQKVGESSEGLPGVCIWIAERGNARAVEVGVKGRFEGRESSPRREAGGAGLGVFLYLNNVVGKTE